MLFAQANLLPQLRYLFFLLGMSPGPDFGMDGKLNQTQKMNNKAEGTPKTESKSKVCLSV